MFTLVLNKTTKTSWFANWLRRKNLQNFLPKMLSPIISKIVVPILLILVHLRRINLSFASQTTFSDAIKSSDKSMANLKDVLVSTVSPYLGQPLSIFFGQKWVHFESCDSTKANSKPFIDPISEVDSTESQLLDFSSQSTTREKEFSLSSQSKCYFT